VRITGGTWASRRIAGPGGGKALRPTPDALREQAFAVLAPEVAGAVFLDLFAGTGINSLEALSRGAAAAILVDRAPASVALIRRNFSALAVPHDRFEIVARDAHRAAPLLAARGLSAAVAWCDPPFSAWEEGPAALALARELGVLTAHAAVVLEAPPKVAPAIEGFEVERALRGAFLLRSVSSLRNRFV
jgi:16S rRNA (guanine966-N2)-methyltransferase